MDYQKAVKLAVSRTKRRHIPHTVVRGSRTVGGDGFSPAREIPSYYVVMEGDEEYFPGGVTVLRTRCEWVNGKLSVRSETVS